jgi:hypothetical protein
MNLTNRHAITKGKIEKDQTELLDISTFESGYQSEVELTYFGERAASQNGVCV